MPDSIDDLYARILRISSDLHSLPDDHPNRTKLVMERDALRIEAATIAASGRHPVSVEREIESIKKRLEEIDRLQITEGYSERRGGKNLQDPGAYSATINRLLSEQHASEIAHLTERLTYLEHLQGVVPADDDG
ncbi:MAG: hypothetical protein GWP18_06915 [Proteobacteria bacterium]|nr:hypothetical protein [Pseudomonadota bacterium]